jgi:hypothetical protein
MLFLKRTILILQKKIFYFNFKIYSRWIQLVFDPHPFAWRGETCVAHVFLCGNGGLKEL